MDVSFTLLLSFTFKIIDTYRLPCVNGISYKKKRVFRINVFIQPLSFINPPKHFISNLINHHTDSIKIAIIKHLFRRRIAYKIILLNNTLLISKFEEKWEINPSVTPVVIPVSSIQQVEIFTKLKMCIICLNKTGNFNTSFSSMVYYKNRCLRI